MFYSWKTARRKYMNSVSFQGNMIITTWNKSVSSSKNYVTTQAQDKLIKLIANDMGKEDEMLSLNKRQANFLYQLLERFTGKKIQKVNNEKVFYHNGDKVIFSDKNPALFDGTRIEVNF